MGINVKKRKTLDGWGEKKGRRKKKKELK